MNRIPICFVSVALFAGVAAGQTRDYSAGFDRMFQLGLPDVKDAEYVQINLQGHSPRSAFDYYWEQMKLQGNGWLLEQPDEHRAIVLMNEGRVLEVHERRRLQQVRREEQAAKPREERHPVFLRDDDDGRIGAEWKPADLKADLKKLIEALERDEDSSRHSRRHELESIGGRAFVYAALAHRKGYTEEATAIVDKLFASAGDPREVILLGVGYLADRQYEAVFYDLRRSWDWEGYGQAIGDLLTRFRAGWQKAPAVERLQRIVALRIEQSTPPALEGDELTEEDQELARALADAAELSWHMQHGLWIFPRTQRRAWGMDTNHPIERIKSRGIAAMPLLLALIDDEFPTTMTFERVGGGMSYYSHRSGPLNEEALRQMFDGLGRPAIRSDVARVLLGQVATEDRRFRLSGTDPDTIREDAAIWFERNRNRSLEDIAVDYLAEGHPEQQTAAATHLLRTGSEEHLGLVEEHIRQAANPWEVSDLVLLCLRIRGEDAHEIAQLHLERLREAAKDLEDDTEQGWLAPSLSQQIATLEELLSGETVETYVAEVVAGQTRIDDQKMMRLQARETRRNGIGAMLRAAHATDDAQIRGDLLQSLAQSALWAGHPRQAISWIDDEQAEDDRLGAWVLDDFREIWTALLDDERESADPMRVYRTPNRSRAAQAIEWALASDDADRFELYRIGTQAGRSFYDWVEERARARLAGAEALTPYPDPKTVPDERREEIRALLMESPLAAIPGLLRALTASERNALAEIADADEELNRHLAPVANRIVTTHDETGSALLQDIAAADRALMERILAQLHRDLEAGLGRVVVVYRADAMDGIGISYRDLDEAMRLATPSPAGGEPHIQATLQGPAGANAAARWSLAESAQALVAEEDGLDDLLAELLADALARLDRAADAEREAFWKGVDQLFDADTKAFRTAMVMLWTVPAAQAEEGADEEEEEL